MSISGSCIMHAVLAVASFVLLRGCSHVSLQAEAHRAQTLADKAAALPPEPASGAADTVAVLIRLPNGQRLTRRWVPPYGQ